MIASDAETFMSLRGQNVAINIQVTIMRQTINETLYET